MSKFKVIGSFTAFLILAGISCWATEQSLHMLLPAGWPEVLVWGITIAFFVVASIGTKMIADSLISNDYVENRTGKLIGGIVLVIFFWLLMSMPTNTHTFFYHDKIGSVISDDIKTTNAYLDQIVLKGTSSTVVCDSAGEEMKKFVAQERNHIVNQFNGTEPPYKKGNGKVLGDHLENINKKLGSNIIHTGVYNSQDPNILLNYHHEIDKALAEALKPHTISDQSVRDARRLSNRLTKLNDSIQDKIATKSISEAEIRQCEAELKNAYNLIARNKTFVDFTPDTDDEQVYTDPNGETRTKRLSSVIDVFFVDFLGGKYPGSFWYYVILSILVDVAAFIFFDIAFMKKED